MIDLSIKPSTEEQVFQEGIADAVGINTQGVKDTWNSPDANILDKAASINDNVLSGVNTTANALDNHIFNKMRVNNQSIVARARNSVLQFPMYITQTCPVAPAHTISKMFERVYTTLVQTVLSQNQIIDEDQANNLVFLKQFHSNLKESADAVSKVFESVNNIYYEAIDELDQMMIESLYHEQRLSENCKVEFRFVPTTNVNLIQECARLCNEPLEGFVYLKEDSSKETNNETSYQRNTISDEEFRSMAMDQCNFSPEQKRILNMSPDDITKEVRSTADPQWDEDDLRVAIQGKIEEHDMANETLDERIRAIKKEIMDAEKGEGSNASKLRKEGYRWDGMRFYRINPMTKTASKTSTNGRAVDAPQILKDTDIKKINGMLPYTIEATFRLRTKEGLDKEVKYIIGIKTVLHLIRTQDLAEDLRDLVTGDVKSLRKVRYKTGEISFKDYLFNTKQLKADAAKHINYNKRWINTLKRLADYKQQYGSFLKGPIKAVTNGDVPIPNATLILTQPDVTTLTNQTGIDLSQVANAKRLAKNLFLIAVCIVDSSAGTMRVLFTDSDNNWDVQSLASIDAEVAKTDNSQVMRELNRIVNR